MPLMEPVVIAAFRRISERKINSKVCLMRTSGERWRRNEKILRICKEKRYNINNHGLFANKLRIPSIVQIRVRFALKFVFSYKAGHIIINNLITSTVRSLRENPKPRPSLYRKASV